MIPARGNHTRFACRLLTDLLKMLSSKVIVAAEVLLALEPESGEERLRDFRNPHGTDITALCEACRERKPLFRFVIRRLMEGGYIRCTNGKNCYAPLRNPADISLLSLVILFHGDLCIGELYDHSLTLGREDFRTPSSRRLRQWEMEQYELLRDAFARTPLTRFRDTAAAIAASGSVPGASAVADAASVCAPAAAAFVASVPCTSAAAVAATGSVSGASAAAVAATASASSAPCSVSEVLPCTEGS